MEQIHRIAIRKSWTTIIRSLTAGQLTRVVDVLVEHGILTMGMKEDIECQTPTSAKVRQLLTIMQRRGPRAFQLFIESLLACEASHLAATLMSNIETDVPSPREVAARVEVTPSESTSVATSEDPMKCNICTELDISIALNPCGHTLCSACGVQVLRDNRCCFCRQPVTNTIRIFL